MRYETLRPTPLQLALIDRWQRDFPLVPEPFAEMAADVCVSELTVLGHLRQLARSGVLSRVGAVLEPNRAGASTLAAIAAPPEALEEVAALVNDEPGVNHNYEREHRYNLWFVVTGADGDAVARALKRIEARTGLPALNLPLETAYHIDLGFPIGARRDRKRPPARPCTHRGPVALSDGDRRLLASIEDGLAIVPRPYLEVARRLGRSEAEVIADLTRLVGDGVIKRFGLVVRHHELGFRANAMVVWDVPDTEVDALGATFAAEPFVTLSYRRPRRLPDWPYNLFCMIHGRERAGVLEQAATLERLAEGRHRAKAVLFSRRRFKQRGARLSAA